MKTFNVNETLEVKITIKLHTRKNVRFRIIEKSKFLNKINPYRVGPITTVLKQYERLREILCVLFEY